MKKIIFFSRCISTFRAMNAQTAKSSNHKSIGKGKWVIETNKSGFCNLDIGNIYCKIHSVLWRSLTSVDGGEIQFTIGARWNILF